MKPSVSIIIPVFNSEENISETINSIINQNIGFESLELIIIDDKSTDNSKSIIQNYENKYENIKGFYLDKNNGTPGKLRNIGIENATADYIMFCDSDDTYALDFCSTMLNVVLKNPEIDLVSSRYNLYNQKDFVGLNNSFLDNYDSILKIGNINNFPELIYTTTNLTIWNKIYKKDFILNNNIKFYENRWNEDLFFSIECFVKSINGFIFLNDYAGYNYIFDNKKITFPSNKSIKQSFNHSISCFEDIKFLINNERNTENLSSEKIIAEPLVMTTRLFLGNNLSHDEQIELLDKIKPFYKSYKLCTRLINSSLLLNMGINIFIKLFALSNSFTIFSSNLYKKLKK